MRSPHPADTERLTFRCWTEDDVELATTLWGDPRVMKMINSQASIDATATRERLQRDMQNLREHLVQFWPMFLRSSGELVGACGLRPRDPQRKVLELGYALRPKFWGQGLATESARSVVEYAFGKLGASALFAGHHADNVASRRTLEKLGFRFTHEEHYAPTNSVHPCYLLERP